MVRQRRDEGRPGGIIMDAQGDQQQMPPRPGDDFRRYGTAALFLTAAGYGLREAKFLQTLLWDKRVNRPALLLFMLSSSVVVALWGYLDVYVGWIQRQRVMYSEARQVTHAILLSILVAGICLNVALWPVYHGWSPVLVFMFSYGVLFQLITLFPAQLYNPLFFCAFAAFVYVYTNQ